MKRTEYPMNHEWHSVCNVANPVFTTGENNLRYMYEGMRMADEVPRMAMLFKAEREKSLPNTHVQCHSCGPTGEPIPDNHLTCCKGVKCSECPALLAIEKMQRVTPEQIDQAKAWTCAAHIVSTGGDVMGEGYLLHVGDRMYWDRVHANLADQEPVDA
jgi:hypothetical protein